jgi:hypothetical protein
MNCDAMAAIVNWISGLTIPPELSTGAEMHELEADSKIACSNFKPVCSYRSCKYGYVTVGGCLTNVF